MTTAATPKRRGRPPVVAVNVQPGLRIVKKYGNRRLYDTQGSRYVNLEELVDLFADEDEVKVLDASSGRDLTEKTLRQALLTEESKRKGSIVPPDLMKPLLRDLKPNELDVWQLALSYGKLRPILDRSPQTDYETGEVLISLIKRGYLQIRG